MRPTAEFINNGKLAEMLIGLELLKSGDPFRENSLFYWHREAANSTAEVDYLTQLNDTVLPIEVKSSTRRAMKSLHMLMAEKSLLLGIRTSQENLNILGNIRIIPHYMISDWKRLLTDIKRSLIMYHNTYPQILTYCYHIRIDHYEI